MSVTRYRDVSEMPPAWFDPGDPRLPAVMAELMRLKLSVEPPGHRCAVVRLELAPPEEGGGFREVEAAPEPEGLETG